MQGSTDTTLYILTVYFGSGSDVHGTPTVGLIADFAALPLHSYMQTCIHRLAHLPGLVMMELIN